MFSEFAKTHLRVMPDGAANHLVWQVEALRLFRNYCRFERVRGNIPLDKRAFANAVCSLGRVTLCEWPVNAALVKSLKEAGSVDRARELEEARMRFKGVMYQHKGWDDDGAKS